MTTQIKAGLIGGASATSYREQACLSNDPAALYGILDEATKASYQNAAEGLAREYSVGVQVVCNTALALSREQPVPLDSRLRLRCHVGYYLIDQDGSEILRRKLNNEGTLVARPDSLRSAIPFAYCALTVILFMLTAEPFVHTHAVSRISGYLALPMVALVALSVANPIMTTITGALIPYRALPRLDLTDGIGYECLTAVLIPALLSDETHVRSLVRSMKEHCVVAHDPNVYVVALTDLPDSDHCEPNEMHRSLLALCKGLIDDLNSDAEWLANKPFFLLHRERSYSSTERKWIGWERKQGKIAQFTSFVRSGRNAFSHSVGDIARLRDTQYALVLDDDSHLGEHAVQYLVGTHAHPLNHPHLAEDLSTIRRGLGILQPSIVQTSYEEQVQSGPGKVTRGWVSEVCDESAFSGKGLIHIETFHTLLDGTLPEQRVLSHDVVESGFVRCGLVPEATVSEMSPTAHESSCKRFHRWVRGDWQNVRFLLRGGSRRPKLSMFGRIMIVQNVIRSLWMSALAITLTLATLVGVRAVLMVLGVAILKCYIEAGVATIDAIRFRNKAAMWAIAMDLWKYPIELAKVITRSGHDTAVALDAIVRTLIRLATKRHLMDWEASSLADGANRKFSLCRRYTWIVAIVSVIAIVAVVAVDRNYWLAALFASWLGYSFESVRQRIG